MTLPTWPVDNLYIHILPKKNFLILLALQVVATEVAVGVVVAAKVAVVLILMVAYTDCL